MDYTTLGRTGLKVSVAGLGCGGVSKLGLRDGNSESEAVAIIEHALERGITLLDTARQYDTEAVVGRAIKGRPRESVVISCKAQTKQGDAVVPVARMLADLDTSLRLLGTDHVDVFHLQGARPEHYDRLVAEHVPALLKERDKGKFRFLGITETAPNDPQQTMLARAVEDDTWDVVMMAFHMLNQTPRQRVLPTIIKKNIGTLMMFVVRNIFSVPGRLQAEIKGQVDAGKLPAALADDKEPLNFLIHEGGAQSLIDAAYRYVRHEPGCNVILFGTSDARHMDTNVASILRPPLPEADRVRLAKVFGHLEGVGLDLSGAGGHAKAP